MMSRSHASGGQVPARALSDWQALNPAARAAVAPVGKTRLGTTGTEPESASDSESRPAVTEPALRGLGPGPSDGPGAAGPVRADREPSCLFSA